MDSVSLPNFSVFVKPIVDDQEDEMNFQDEVDDQVVLDDQLDEDFDENLDRDEEDDAYNEDEEEDADDPNKKEYTNGKGTLDDDNQTSDETDNKKDSAENPIAPNNEGDNASSDAKEPATEQTGGPPDALKDAKQQWEDDQKTASDENKDTKQQAEETQKMASDTYKDTKQQAEETQKMASDAYKDTTQQMEKTQKMASDAFKDANKVMGTANKPFVPSNENNNALQPQENKVSDTPPNTQLLPQHQQLEAHAKSIPSVQEKAPIPSGVVAPKTQIQTVRVSPPQAQAKQQPQQDSISPPKAEAQPQVNHETVASQKTQPQPQPETQMQASSIPMVPEKIGSPSGGVVAPTPTPEEDATNLHRAFKGSGCDVGQLVQVLSRHRHDPKHRHLIQQHYKKNYGEDLRDRISSELSTFGKGFLKEKVGLDLSMKATGSLGWLCKDSKRAISLWLLEESERDATIVWQSLQLMSLDKAALTEVICSRTPSQIRSLKRAYFTYFKSELSKDIGSSTLLINSNTKELLVACLDDKARDEGTDVDLKMAEEDATQLFKDGEKIWGTTNKTFIDIFTKRNRPHLAAVDAAYDKLYGHSLEEAVRKETSRSFQAGLLTLLKCAKNPAKYFAEVLYNSMKGLGTSDTTLIRVVVTRAGIDMEDIKKEYVQAYKTSLKDRIHDDTSGDYRTFLLNLVE